MDKIKIDMRVYCFLGGGNLGDVMGLEILKKYFSEFEFNPLSKNYLFFGGSTFHHHLTYLTEKPNFILFFGNGLSCFEEMVMPECDYKIFPRGSHTKCMLDRMGIKSEEVIGDIAQFISNEEVIETRGDGEVFIKDAFKDINYIPENSNIISVCDDNLTTSYKLINTMDNFKIELSNYMKIISSQIHPFLISLMWGFPAKLVPKDIRALDITSFFDIPFDCMEEDAKKVRKISQNNITNMKEILINELNKFRV